MSGDITSADLNGDGKPDLVVSHSTNDSGVSVLVNQGNGTFGPALNHAGPAYSGAIDLGDLNADGRTDVAITGSVKKVVGVLLDHCIP